MRAIALCLALLLAAPALLLAPPAAAADPVCGDAWVSRAVYEVTREPARKAVCEPRWYGQGAWSDYGDLVRKVRQTMSTCGDAWITQAYVEMFSRLPAGNECTVSSYGGGHWDSYADLRNKIQATHDRCADPWVDQAVFEVTGLHATRNTCMTKWYGDGQWRDHDDLKRKVQARLGFCKDTWVTLAYLEIYARAPTAAECDPSVYSDGSKAAGTWDSYAQLHQFIRHAQKCGDIWIYKAVRDITRVGPSGVPCQPRWYNDGTWSSYAELEGAVRGTLSACPDPAWTLAFLSATERLPRGIECTADLYLDDVSGPLSINVIVDELRSDHAECEDMNVAIAVFKVTGVPAFGAGCRVYWYTWLNDLETLDEDVERMLRTCSEPVITQAFVTTLERWPVGEECDAALYGGAPLKGVDGYKAVAVAAARYAALPCEDWRVAHAWEETLGLFPLSSGCRSEMYGITPTQDTASARTLFQAAIARCARPAVAAAYYDALGRAPTSQECSADLYGRGPWTTQDTYLELYKAVATGSLCADPRIDAAVRPRLGMQAFDALCEPSTYGLTPSAPDAEVTRAVGAAFASCSDGRVVGAFLLLDMGTPRADLGECSGLRYAREGDALAMTQGVARYFATCSPAEAARAVSGALGVQALADLCALATGGTLDEKVEAVRAAVGCGPGDDTLFGAAYFYMTGEKAEPCAPHAHGVRYQRNFTAYAYAIRVALAKREEKGPCPDSTLGLVLFEIAGWRFQSYACDPRVWDLDPGLAADAARAHVERKAPSGCAPADTITLAGQWARLPRADECRIFAERLAAYGGTRLEDAASEAFSYCADARASLAIEQALAIGWAKPVSRACERSTWTPEASDDALVGAVTAAAAACPNKKVMLAFHDVLGRAPSASECDLRLVEDASASYADHYGSLAWSYDPAAEQAGRDPLAISQAILASVLATPEVSARLPASMRVGFVAAGERWPSWSVDGGVTQPYASGADDFTVGLSRSAAHSLGHASDAELGQVFLRLLKAGAITASSTDPAKQAALKAGLSDAALARLSTSELEAELCEGATAFRCAQGIVFDAAGSPVGVLSGSAALRRAPEGVRLDGLAGLLGVAPASLRAAARAAPHGSATADLLARGTGSWDDVLSAAPGAIAGTSMGLGREYGLGATTYASTGEYLRGMGYLGGR